MGDVNWGLLQSSAAPAIRASEPMAQGAPSPMSAPPAANYGAGLGNLAQNQIERQKMAIQQQQFQQEMGLKNKEFGLLQNQDSRTQQLQPGVLQQQGLTTQGMGLENQTKQQQLQMAQYQMQMRQKEAQAYTEGKARGGTEGGLDAIQQTKFENGDVDGGTKFADWRQQAKEKLANENQREMLSSVDLIHSAVAQEKPPIPPFQDPQTGQMRPGNPGITALDNYKAQLSNIRKGWPGAPDPSSFKDNDDFKNNFATPVIGTATPIKEQVASNLKAQQNDDIHKANLEVKSATTDLNNAIAKYGAKSQEVNDAAQILQNAQTNASRVAIGGGAGALGVMSRTAVNRFANSTKDLIKAHTPVQTTSQPTTTPITVDHEGKTYTKENGQWTYK